MKPVSHSKRLLITGISGFTGKYVSEYFEANGYEVHGLGINYVQKSKYHQCDLRHLSEIRNVIATIRPTHVLHLAGISFAGERNALLMYEMNVLATANLLDVLATSNLIFEKIIIASSAIVYGNQDNGVLDERMCPHPTNHYGCSKLSMELIAQTYINKLPILTVRPFNYTGPGQAKHFLIPKIVSHYKEKREYIELGNLHVEREFNDIRDICKIYAALLECQHDGNIVNLCTGRGISLLSVLEVMNEIAGYEMKVTINPQFIRANEIRRLVGSTTYLDAIINRDDPRDFTETLQYMYNS